MLTAVEEKLTVVNFFRLLTFGDVCTQLIVTLGYHAKHGKLRKSSIL